MGCMQNRGVVPMPGYGCNRLYSSLIYSHIFCSAIVKDIAVRAGCLGFDSLAGQIGHGVASATTFLRSCAAQALSHGDGLRYSSHASA